MVIFTNSLILDLYILYWKKEIQSMINLPIDNTVSDGALRGEVDQNLNGNGNRTKPNPRFGENSWTEREHALYVIFLENNRQKAKSKLFRRSNTFFFEMGKFIGTKTLTQCRSFHKKFDSKYTYPHKIIKQEKKKIDIELYKELKAHEDQVIFSKTQDGQKKEEILFELVVPQSEVACQTEIEGARNHLSMERQQMPSRAYYPFCLPQHQHSSFPPSIIWNVSNNRPYLND